MCGNKSLLSAFPPQRVLYYEIKMGEDATLLREYAQSGSDRAFSGLVDRHFNLVYATALRIASGDAHLAQDVVQSVFTDFASKARSLPRDVILGGWLYKHTCFVAANAIRQEQRRRTREKQAFEMNSANEPSDPIWSRLGPVLDEAMSRLRTSDRDALVLRFFEQKSLRTVGTALGISEEAARKRVDRALERLRDFFARRGLCFSAGVLSSALDGHAAAAAPAGLSSVVANAALVEAAKGGAAGLSLIKLITITRLMTITKAKIAMSAVAVAMTAAIIIQSKDNSRLKQDNRELREQSEALSDQLRTATERPAEASGLDQNQVRELMRLRGEVGLLRDQLARAKKAQETKVNITKSSTSGAEVPTESASDDPVAQQLKTQVAKMNFSKLFMLAMHGGGDTNDLATEQFYNQFQVVYQGSLNEITNPSGTIVLREKTPWQAAGGGWLRVYGLADGASVVHEEPDGNFEPWESQHTQKPAGQ
jgi:RNA polymerase sigma factor (sigma-70 family)